MDSASRVDPGNVATGVKSRRAQRGVAAVEFAIILPVMIIMLMIPVFFARVFMHYSVAAKAAQSAAMYLATIPRQEMEYGPRKTAATLIAANIANITVAELRPGGEYPVGVDIECDGLTCLGPIAPKQVRVTVRMWMVDEISTAYTAGLIPETGVPITYAYTMPYLGE